MLLRPLNRFLDREPAPIGDAAAILVRRLLDRLEQPWGTADRQEFRRRFAPFRFLAHQVPAFR